MIPSTRFSTRITFPLAIFLLFLIYSHHGIFTNVERYSKTTVTSSPPSPPPLTEQENVPSFHLIGDSSMCKGGTNDGVKGVIYEGWGEFVQDYVLVPVTSHAISGRSCRMYAREGRFDKVLSVVKPNDYVLIQFGRNEKGKLVPKDNGKTVCPGADITGTCESVFQGEKTTVLTFGGYIANATEHFKQLGVNVIIAAPTPNNAYSFTSDGFFTKPSEWVGLSEGVASWENVTYIDHFRYGIEMMRRIGKNETQKLYPVKSDRTHTNRVGADMMARAFMRGLMCSDSKLVKWVNSTAFGRVGG
ncbi:hypothetical protein TWF281_005110 [Arthrobotrys megalospora]